MKGWELHSVFWFLVLLLISPSVDAQDIHFSQYYQSPLNVNPALCGQFKGAYRITGIYRSQWASVTVPYTTMAFSGEAKNAFKVKKLNLGGDIMYDKAGDGNMGTFAINLSSSYDVYQWDNNTKKISAGMQLGWAQRQIDPTKLNFENTLTQGQSLENFAENYSYLSSKFGVLYTQKLSGNNLIRAGYSFDNLFQFSSNFYANENDRNDIKHNIYAQVSFDISPEFALIPSTLFLFQGTHRQITLGSQVKYTLNNSVSAYRALYAGLFTRAGDAAFVSLGMDYNTLNVGISYDFNYSALTKSSNGRGAFEISFVYLFNTPLPPRKRFKSCPNYI